MAQRGLRLCSPARRGACRVGRARPVEAVNGIESATPRRIGFRTMSDHAARTRNAGVVVKQLEAARAALRRQDDEKEALEHTMRVRPRPPAPAEGSRAPHTCSAPRLTRARAPAQALLALERPTAEEGARYRELKVRHDDLHREHKHMVARLRALERQLNGGPPPQPSPMLPARLPESTGPSPRGLPATERTPPPMSAHRGRSVSFAELPPQEMERANGGGEAHAAAAAHASVERMEGEEAAFEKQHPLLSCRRGLRRPHERVVLLRLPVPQAVGVRGGEGVGSRDDRTPLDDAHHLRA